MLSTLENRLKRPAEDSSEHTIKRLRYAEVHRHKGIKRRSEEETDVLEPAKKSRITPCSKGVKRESDTVLEHPIKRMKTTHMFSQHIIMILSGCRSYNEHHDDNDDFGGHPSSLISVIA